MKQISTTENNVHLKRFAVKSSKKKIVINNRTVIYNRCSTEKQDSLAWQDNACANLCRQSNYDLVKTFGAKESATTDDRVVFKEMLKFCEREKIGHIVVYSYDRFTRSGDIGLLKKLRKKGTKVHAVTQTVDDQTASGRFSQSMYLMFAEMENEQRREKIIEGLKSKLRKGEWPGSPPIGYEKKYITGKKEHDHDKRQCFINETGIILRQAFHWKAIEKLSTNEITEKMKNLGLTITTHQLNRIFRNPFYCGFITFSLLNDGEMIRGKHEALISEDIFLTVNGIINSVPRGWNIVRQNDQMPLKSSVICAICTRNLTAYSRRKKYFYYKCPNKGCCVNIRNHKLHELFASELSKYSIAEAMIPIIRTQLQATYKVLRNSECERMKPMKDELTKLKKELETMEFNFATSRISAEIFQKFSDNHKKKIWEIDENLKLMNYDSSNFEKLMGFALKYSSNLLNLWQLLDYCGKVRLQKMIFPEGLQFYNENHTLRTVKLNPIISAITTISTYNSHNSNTEIIDKNENLRQVNLMFGSSNFFMSHLEEMNTQMVDFEREYPQVWQNVHVSYLNQGTGRTETAVFKYASNHTLHFQEPCIFRQDLFHGGVGVMSGMTGQRMQQS